MVYSHSLVPLHILDILFGHIAYEVGIQRHTFDTYIDYTVLSHLELHDDILHTLCLLEVLLTYSLIIDIVTYSLSSVSVSSF